MSSCFSLASHTCVLDVGAHIGIFSRLALAEGCSRIIAYEPEPTNFELLSRNMNIVKPTASKSSLPVIELHSAAVVNGTSGSGTLVRARNENSGKQNTWRHSLEDYSQYVDRTTDLPSVFQKKTLDRFPVDCVSFFGGREELKQKSALVPGVTFVKLDCEGAEIDILLNEEASRRSSWLDCTHLVVEWSFTKERRVDIFHKAINNLKLAGAKTPPKTRPPTRSTSTATGGGRIQRIPPTIAATTIPATMTTTTMERVSRGTGTVPVRYIAPHTERCGRILVQSSNLKPTSPVQPLAPPAPLTRASVATHSRPRLLNWRWQGKWRWARLVGWHRVIWGI